MTDFSAALGSFTVKAKPYWTVSGVILRCDVILLPRVPPINGLSMVSRFLLPPPLQNKMTIDRTVLPQWPRSPEMPTSVNVQ